MSKVKREIVPLFLINNENQRLSMPVLQGKEMEREAKILNLVTGRVSKDYVENMWLIKLIQIQCYILEQLQIQYL